MVKKLVALKGKLVFVNDQLVSVNNSEEIEAYEGDYEITPTTKEQILETADKKMKQDLTVKAIPFVEVSNTSGGKTVIIG